MYYSFHIIDEAFRLISHTVSPRKFKLSLKCYPHTSPELPSFPLSLPFPDVENGHRPTPWVLNGMDTKRMGAIAMPQLTETGRSLWPLSFWLPELEVCLCSCRPLPHHFWHIVLLVGPWYRMSVLVMKSIKLKSCHSSQNTW